MTLRPCVDGYKAPSDEHFSHSISASRGSEGGSSPEMITLSLRTHNYLARRSTVDPSVSLLQWMCG